jgi:hypothetical protein
MAIIIKQLKDQFKKEEWSIADIRGDGLCMMNSILISGERSDLNSTKLFIKCVQSYFKKYPGEEMYILKSNNEPIVLNSETTTDTIKHLLDDNNLDNRLLIILSDILDINILVLTYDVRSKEPDRFTFYKAPESKKIVILINWGGHFRPLIAKSDIKHRKYMEITKGREQGRWFI